MDGEAIEHEKRNNRSREAAARVLAKLGRPRDYTTELGSAICELITTAQPDTGRPMTLRDACAQLDLPERTVYVWLVREADFQQMYDRARETRAHMQAERLQDMAAAETDVQRAKLVVDTEKWTLSKLAPRTYGDRTIHAGDRDNPIRIDPLSQILGAVVNGSRGLPSTDGDAEK